MSNLIPDFFNEPNRKTPESMLEFCVLKMIHKMAKRGISMQ
jgi:hypothetical protein